MWNAATFCLSDISHAPEMMATQRTCLIVGATTGIGKETAEHLARKGWTVIVTGRNQDKGDKVGSAIHADVHTSNDNARRS